MAVGVALGVDLGDELGVGVGVAVAHVRLGRHKLGVGSPGVASVEVVPVLLDFVGAGSSDWSSEPGSLSRPADATTTAAVVPTVAKSTLPAPAPRIQRRHPDDLRGLMFSIIRTAV